MTYPVLSALVLVGVAAACIPTLRMLAPRPLLLAAGVLSLLTLVFDNIIVGVGIVEYDDALISGVRVPVAPIEDFSYALAAVVLVPVLWTVLGAGSRPSPAGDDDGDGDAA